MPEFLFVSALEKRPTPIIRANEEMRLAVRSYQPSIWSWKYRESLDYWRIYCSVKRGHCAGLIAANYSHAHRRLQSSQNLIGLRSEEIPLRQGTERAVCSPLKSIVA